MHQERLNGFLSWYACFALLGCVATSSLCFQITGIATHMLQNQYSTYLSQPGRCSFELCVQPTTQYRYMCGQRSGFILVQPFSFAKTKCMNQVFYEVE